MKTSLNIWNGAVPKLDRTHKIQVTRSTDEKFYSRILKNQSYGQNYKENIPWHLRHRNKEVLKSCDIKSIQQFDTDSALLKTLGNGGLDQVVNYLIWFYVIANNEIVFNCGIYIHRVVILYDSYISCRGVTRGHQKYNIAIDLSVATIFSDFARGCISFDRRWIAGI